MGLFLCRDVAALEQLIVDFVRDLVRTPSRVLQGSPSHQRAYGWEGKPLPTCAGLAEQSRLCYIARSRERRNQLP